METLLSGAAFGAALTASGVFDPQAIVSQLTLQDWHMLQTFLTAIGSSALIVSVARKFENLKLDISPRSPSHLGLITRYDGNLIGGMLLGAGMAFAGACPGTVLAQVAVGIPSGIYALAGGVLGGVAWTGLLRPLMTRRKPAPVASETKSWHEALQLSRAVVLLASETMYALVIATTLFLTDSGAGRPINGVTGGLIIGGAQLLSLILRGKLVGVSTCYEDVGDWFWWSTDTQKAHPKYDTILFSGALMGGALAVSSAVPSLSRVDPAGVAISPLSGLFGGFLMTVGARVAGGCTSGHGISGMSMLSTSSLVTIGTALVTGAAVALKLY